MNPYSYLEKFTIVIKKLQSGKYNLVHIKELCHKITDGTHYTPTYVNDGVKFLSVKDVRENKINFSVEKFITLKEHNALIKRCNPEPNDVLLTKIGTIGLAAVIPAEAPKFSIFVSVALLKIKNSINPYYVSLYLNSSYAKSQMDRVLKGVGVPDYHLENIREMLIPCPDSMIQKEIVEFYNAAYQQKQEKETQAKQLLAGIDDYLLSELGITLPEQDNSLNKRIFTTKFSKLTGSRFDPVVQFYVDCGESELHHNQLLKSIAVIEKGTSITKDQVISGIYPVIAGGQSSPYSHNKLNYNGNVITVSASGAYAGFVWYHNNPIFASDCCVIYSKDESVITTEFISEVLKFKQNDIYKLQQGAGQPHVYGSDLAKISMVIPSLEKQKEIAAKISKIRQEAKRLQEDGANILANAKIRVEQMILGN